MAAGKGGVPADRALLDPDGVFPARLAADRSALAALAAGLWTLGAEAREKRLRLIATLAHRLGGAAGTFGYAAIGEAALALEDEILARQPDGDDAPVRHAADALLRALDDGLAGP